LLVVLKNVLTMHGHMIV